MFVFHCSLRCKNNNDKYKQKIKGNRWSVGKSHHHNVTESFVLRFQDENLSLLPVVPESDKLVSQQL